MMGEGGILIPDGIVEWLLEEENPSVRYRTMVELLDRSEDDVEVKRTRERIATSEPVRILLEGMHPDGYWLQQNPRTGEILGDGVDYGAYGTTHYMLSYLSELGMDRSNPQISRAAERYLDLQQDDGDFLRHFSCLLGYNIRTFVMLGYRDDVRVRRSINLLLDTDRPDGGYLCDMHEGKYKTRATKSCIRGAVKALLAFSELPEHWESDRVGRLVDYFLERGGIFKSTDHTVFVNRDMRSVSFPITAGANAFEVLLALGRMGHGDDGRLAGAWKVMDSNRNGEGRYMLDWTAVQCPWKVGKRGEPNKWVTFYCYLARKFG
jgi:hypothetical protein